MCILTFSKQVRNHYRVESVYIVRLCVFAAADEWQDMPPAAIAELD